MLFFPALKGFITDSESDSIYLEYIDWLLNNNLNKINSFERLDEIVQELSRIYQFLSIINTFKELIDKVPPVVHLEEFILADKLTDKLRKGIPIEITVDTVKLELFSCWYANCERRI